MVNESFYLFIYKYYVSIKFAFSHGKFSDLIPSKIFRIFFFFLYCVQETESATLEAISKSKLGSVWFLILLIFHFGTLLLVELNMHPERFL